MKKFSIKVMCLACAWAMAINPILACTAAPKADVSKPGSASKPATYHQCVIAAATPETVTQPQAQTKPKEQPEMRKKTQTDGESTQNTFVIDNFKVIQGALNKLGVPPEELEVMIKEGKKLPEVLEIKNIKVAKFKKALLKQYYSAISEGVENKQITKEEAKMLRGAIKDKVMSWLEVK